MNKIYDYIIIGSGISGLYSAELISQKTQNYMILEKRSQSGGRIQVATISNTQVATGAGVIRKNDTDFINLYKKLLPEEEVKFFKHEINYEFVEGNFKIVKDTIKFLNSACRENETQRSKKNFKQFSLQYLTPQIYKRFLTANMYQDFNNADYIDTLSDYGFEDNVPGGLIFAPKWKKFIDVLTYRHKNKIFYNKTVVSIENNDYYNKVVVSTGKVLLCKKLIIAVTTEALQKLICKKIYKSIKSQPFIRVYVNLNIPLPLPYGITLTNNALQKIIPIHSKKCHLYMICYADNERAIFMKKKSSSYILSLLKEMFDLPKLEILEIKKVYWQEGTHYYLPLPKKYENREEFLEKAQMPCGENLFVVGEMVSRNQGWVQGAMESVNKILFSR